MEEKEKEKFTLPEIIDSGVFSRRLWPGLADAPQKLRQKRNEIGTARITEADKMAIKAEIKVIISELKEYIKKL